MGYLAYTNPDLNFQKRILLEQQESQASAKLMEWRYDELSDVGVEDEKYPIVVLRTGFKLLKIEEKHAIVGWIYEAINTSPSSQYLTEVDFKLTDIDEFELEGGNSEQTIEAHSSGIIKGQIKISKSDIPRLSQSTWTVRLTPSWQTKEKNTTGKRYDRLKAIIIDNEPYWIKETLEKNKILTYFPKWQIIQEAINDKNASKKQAVK